MGGMHSECPSSICMHLCELLQFSQWMYPTKQGCYCLSDYFVLSSSHMWSLLVTRTKDGSDHNAKVEAS